MSDKGTEQRSVEERIADALECIAAAYEFTGVPMHEKVIREEWRRRYAGVALEGLLANDSPGGPSVLAATAVQYADALLDALGSQG